MNDHYSYPYLYQIFDGAWWKALVALCATVIASLQNLVDFNVKLLVLIILLVAVDWHTGRGAARRAKKVLTATGWKQTIRKVNQYAMFIFTCTIVSHGFEGYHMYFQWVEIAAYLFVASTELKSITENIFDQKQGREIFRFMTRFLRSRPDITTTERRENGEDPQ